MVMVTLGSFSIEFYLLRCDVGSAFLLPMVDFRALRVKEQR